MTRQDRHVQHPQGRPTPAPVHRRGPGAIDADVVVLQEATDPTVVRFVADTLGARVVINAPGRSVAVMSRLGAVEGRWHRMARARSFAEVDLPELGFRILAVHLSAGLSARGERRRLREVDRLLAVADAAPGPERTLIAGDLNAIATGDVPDVAALPRWIRLLLRVDGGIGTLVVDRLLADGFVDAFRTCHPTGERIHDAGGRADRPARLHDGRPRSPAGPDGVRPRGCRSGPPGPRVGPRSGRPGARRSHVAERERSRAIHTRNARPGTDDAPAAPLPGHFARVDQRSTFQRPTREDEPDERIEQARREPHARARPDVPGQAHGAGQRDVAPPDAHGVVGRGPRRGDGGRALLGRAPAGGGARRDPRRAADPRTTGTRRRSWPSPCRPGGRAMARRR